MGSSGGGSSAKANEINEEMNKLAREQFEYYKEEKVKQQAKGDEQRKSFEAFEFTNPFARARNEFADLETQFENLGESAFEGMENRFEDMTVDMRAADFQRQQMQQQQANILQNLRGAAGTSGVAGLAQVMANQGALQTQQIAAGISQQERQNQMMAAQEGARIDQLQRGAGMQLQQLEAGGAQQLQAQQAAGAMQTQQMRMAGAAQQQQMVLGGAAQAQALEVAQRNLQAQGQGAIDMAAAQGQFQTDMAIMQGEGAVQAAEFGQLSTLLGMDYAALASANQGVSQGMANQMSALGMQANMHGAQGSQIAGMWGALIGAAGTAVGGGWNPF